MKKLFFSITLCLISFAAQATPLMQYTAVVTTTQGGQVSSGKMYIDNNKIRVEAKVQGEDVYSIIRPDLGKLYSVIPSQKLYTEIPITQNDLKMMTPYSEDTQMTAIADETIKGVPATKYKMDQIEGSVYLWVGKKNKAPLLMTAEETGVKTEWTDLKVGPPDAKLFDPPVGYKKLEANGAAPDAKTQAPPATTQPPQTNNGSQF